MGEEVEGLEDHADVGAEPGQHLALFGQDLPVDFDAARIDGFQAVDGAAQGRFSGAGGSQDNDDLALGDFEVDVLQDVQRAVVLVDSGQLDDRNQGRPSATLGGISAHEYDLSGRGLNHH